VACELKVLVRRHEGKEPLLILWRIWEDNIKTDLREMEWGWGRALD
jgi:hypothetical protein